MGIEGTEVLLGFALRIMGQRLYILLRQPKTYRRWYRQVSTDVSRIKTFISKFELLDTHWYAYRSHVPPYPVSRHIRYGYVALHHVSVISSSRYIRSQGFEFKDTTGWRWKQILLQFLNSLYSSCTGSYQEAFEKGYSGCAAGSSCKRLFWCFGSCLQA